MSDVKNRKSHTRLDQARTVALQLLDEMETEEYPVERHLLKAKRLARLLRDTDAQTWLDLEIRGYPTDFRFDELGNCRRYAEAGGRITANGKYYRISLPELEARCQTDRASLDKSAGIKQSPTGARDYTAAGATVKLIADQLKMLNDIRTAYLRYVALLSSLKAALHSYVTDTSLSIEFGDIAQNTFEEARFTVDRFIRTGCPKAAEKLVAIDERMREGAPESRSAALTSCRRLLMDVADAVFPPSDEDWVDPSGNRRKVGRDQYKNRLLAFLQQRIESEGSKAMLTAEVEHLSARLDAIYEKTCKGVHGEVTRAEARLVVIQTYLLVAEIARLAEPVAS